MPRGGARPNTGRKPGSAARKTRELADQGAAASLSPLEYMLAVMRDEEADRAARMDAAKAAAPFMHARLSPMAMEGRDECGVKTEPITSRQVMAKLYDIFGEDVYPSRPAAAEAGSDQVESEIIELNQGLKAL